jgi:hypothetical protein
VHPPAEIVDLARCMAARGGPSSGIGAFLNADGRPVAEAPLVTGSVTYGASSPAEVGMENRPTLTSGPNLTLGTRRQEPLPTQPGHP